LERSVYDVLTDRCTLADALQTSEAGGYALLPANADLTAAEVELLEMKMKESRLRYALAGVRENYDFILIDCPPSLNMLTVNGLVADDGMPIPLQCENYSLECLSGLFTTIQRTGWVLNP